MVLNRNPDNFFAETEQVAFHPGQRRAWIDFTNDPLLQGRLFSYLDTQLIAAGRPELPRAPDQPPECPMRNFQRDGIMRMRRVQGPRRLRAQQPRARPARARIPTRGFRTFAAQTRGRARRQAAHARRRASPTTTARRGCSSARMSEPEQRHIVSAFAFELGKVETVADPQAHARSPDDHRRGARRTASRPALGMEGQADDITPARDADRHGAVADASA